MNNFDVIRYLSDKDLDYKKSGKNIGGDWIGINPCPFPNCGAGGYHFGINVKTGATSCWLCGGHSLRDTLFQWERNWGKVNKVLQEYRLDADKIIFHEEKEIIRPQHYSLPIEFTENFSDPYKIYLKNRGFNFLELKKKYGILCGSDFGRGRYRVIFPVFENGKIVNWVGRTILKDKKIMPYMFEKNENNPYVIREELLYGLDDCKGDTVILVEGVFDKINIGTNCVALLLIDFSKKQLLKLRRFKNFFLALDQEEKAQRRAKELESYLFWADNINYINFDKKDPGEFTKKEVLELRRMIF